jgi:hypothetical protein
LRGEAESARKPQSVPQSVTRIHLS